MSAWSFNNLGMRWDALEYDTGKKYGGERRQQRHFMKKYQEKLGDD